VKEEQCRRCKRPFPPVNAQQLYCTTRCRQSAYRDRKRCPHCGVLLTEKPKKGSQS